MSNVSEDVNHREWIKTDDLQFVSQNGNEFTVVEISFLNDGWFVTQEIDINFDHLDECDYKSAVSAYYSSLEEVKNLYGEDWKRVVAEIIAEQTAFSSDDFQCDSEEELHKYLEGHYGIVV